MSKFKTRQNLNDQNFSQQTGNTLTLSGNLRYGTNPTRIFTKNTIVDVNYVTGITSSASISGATNGLNVVNRTTRLGGSLINDTTIDVNGKTLSFSDNINSTGFSIDSEVGGGSILLAHSYVGNLEFKSSGTIFTDTRGTKRGIQYGSNYSSGFNARSLVDAGFVTGITSLFIVPSGVTFAGNGLNRQGSVVRLGGTLTGDTTINIGTGNTLNIENGFSIWLASENVSLVGTGAAGTAQIGSDNTGIYIFQGAIETNVYDGVSVNAIRSYMTGNDWFVGVSNSSPVSGFSGIQYYDDYSLQYTSRSLVDKGYVTGKTITTPITKIISGSTTLDESATTWVYTGSGTSTWTLPSVSSNIHLLYMLKNRGGNTVTVERGGSDNIYDSSSVTSVALNAGSKMYIQSDGVFWLVI